MASHEEIKELVRKALVEILIEDPNILLEALVKVAPWTSVLSTIEDIKKSMATKNDLEDLERKIQVRLDALGARWGLVNEETLREGIRSLLKETGYIIERWIWDDKERSVYGHPSIVDLDVVVKDKTLIVIDITSSVRRGDHIFLKKKAELFERVTGRKPSKIIIITPFIADRNPDEVILRAKEAESI